MITAVDTNVLIDVFRNDSQFGAASANALRKAIHEGRVVVCDVVLAELTAAFQTKQAMEKAIGPLSLDYIPVEREAAVLAGLTWRKYRASGGKRVRVMADFLIAAHAQVHCDRLLTRDRGFYRKYFTKLRVLDPTRG